MINKSFCIYFHHNNHCQTVVMGLYKPLFLHVGYLSKVLFPSYSTLTNQSNLLFRKKIWDWVIKNSTPSLGSNYISWKENFSREKSFQKIEEINHKLGKICCYKICRTRVFSPRGFKQSRTLEGWNWPKYLMKWCRVREF